MAIDPELIHALHLTVEDHDAAASDAARAHHVFQTSTVQALIDSRYDGDLTMAELLAHGDLGLGTLDGLDGELIIDRGQAYVARVDG
jgi:acetolactate decarboxylase